MKQERIPRPLGFTYLAQTMHTTNNEEEKQRIKEKLINKTIDIYVSQGMMLNGKTISLQEMASYLDIPLRNLMKRVNRGFKVISDMFEGDGARENARVGIFRALNFALEGKASAEAQLAILMASQGDEYKPFISSEVNKAITNNVNAIKPLVDILKLMMDSQEKPNGTMAPTQNVTQNNNLFLTQDAAISLLNNQPNSVLTNPELLDQAYQNMALLGVPEVIATKQDNLADTGLRIDGLTTSKPKPKPEEPNTDRHEGRREASEGHIILDEDEFRV